MWKKRGAGAVSEVYLWAQRQDCFAEGSWVVLMGEPQGDKETGNTRRGLLERPWMSES